MGEPVDVHVSGVVIPCAWNASHRVIAIALSTTAESELVVSEGLGRGAELRAWMHHRLSVSGNLDESGRLIVLDFAPEPNPEDTGSPVSPRCAPTRRAPSGPEKDAEK